MTLPAHHPTPPPDPRVCRVPPPWNHLSLAGVAECEKLAFLIVGHLPLGGRSSLQNKRLAALLKRRVRPQYETARKDGAA